MLCLLHNSLSNDVMIRVIPAPNYVLTPSGLRTRILRVNMKLSTYYHEYARKKFRAERLLSDIFSINIFFEIFFMVCPLRNPWWRNIFRANIQYRRQTMSTTKRVYISKSQIQKLKISLSKKLRHIGLEMSLVSYIKIFDLGQIREFPCVGTILTYTHAFLHPRIFAWT